MFLFPLAWDGTVAPHSTGKGDTGAPDSDARSLPASSAVPVLVCCLGR